jgi:phage terminase large subunit-like protein
LETEELQFDDVKRYLTELNSLYAIQGVYFDPYQAIQLSQDLKKENINMVELPQTQSNCIAFSQCLFDLIKNKKVGFYQSEEIRLSLVNCKVIYSNRGWRIIKKTGTKKIDLAIALAMASYGAVTSPGQGTVEEFAKMIDDVAGQEHLRDKNLSSQFADGYDINNPSNWGGPDGYRKPGGDW